MRLGDGADGAGHAIAAPQLLVARVSFEDFYRDRYPDMVRLATLLVGSVDTAQDLVQDCFVKLHPRWTVVTDPLRYVRRSVVNACHSHHRRLRRFRQLGLRPGDAVELDADEMADALAALPHRQRAALVLRFYDGLHDAEIAELLGCRTGTVASLVHRGLASLRLVIDP
ncbi:MAG: SigE family RNA polymerase sigma factor [Acidimicrobiia bacterium]